MKHSAERLLDRGNLLLSLVELRGGVDAELIADIKSLQAEVSTWGGEETYGDGSEEDRLLNDLFADLEEVMP